MDCNSEKYNPSLITCKSCDSKILLKHVGLLIHHETKLPIMNQKKSTEIEHENVTDFYEIQDIMMFENIGFSNTVDNIKYLVCADCERGPIGYHHIRDQKSFLAIDRVKLQNT